MNFKKYLVAIAMGVSLSACVKNIDNVDFLDAYWNKNSLFTEKLSDEKREKLVAYVARKSVLFQYYINNVLFLDSRETQMAGEWVEQKIKVENKPESIVVNGKEYPFTGVLSLDVGNISIYVFERDGVRIISQIYRPSEKEMKELLSGVTVSQAIDEENSVSVKVKEAEALRNELEAKEKEQNALNKGIRIGFVEKSVGETQNILNIDFTFTNMFPKKIKEFQGVIKFYDKDGVFYLLRIRESEGIDSRSALYYEGELDLKTEQEFHILNMSAEDMRVKFVVEGVLFEDGSILGQDLFTKSSPAVAKEAEDKVSTPSQEKEASIEALTTPENVKAQESH